MSFENKKENSLFKRGRNVMLFGFTTAMITTSMFFGSRFIGLKYFDETRILNSIKNEGNKSKHLLYIGNVPIKYRLQYTYCNTCNEYWRLNGYNIAIELGYKSLIYSTLFSITIIIGFCGLFIWYNNINELNEIDLLFKKWMKPLKDKLSIEYIETDYDKEINQKIKDMSLTEFIHDLAINYDEYEHLSRLALEEQKKIKDINQNMDHK